MNVFIARLFIEIAHCRLWDLRLDHQHLFYSLNPY
jgi:hypothetical protein